MKASGRFTDQEVWLSTWMKLHNDTLYKYYDSIPQQYIDRYEAQLVAKVLYSVSRKEALFKMYISGEACYRHIPPFMALRKTMRSIEKSVKPAVRLKTSTMVSKRPSAWKGPKQ